MRKSTWFISATVLLMIAAFIYLPRFTKNGVPKAELSLHSPAKGGTFKLTNTGKDPIFYTGYSKDFAIMSAQATSRGHHLDGLGWCGTGMEDQRLDPGKSVLISSAFSEHAYEGKPVTVHCTVWSSESDWNRVKSFLRREFGLNWSWLGTGTGPAVLEVATKPVVLEKADS